MLINMLANWSVAPVDQPFPRFCCVSVFRVPPPRCTFLARCRSLEQRISTAWFRHAAPTFRVLLTTVCSPASPSTLGYCSHGNTPWKREQTLVVRPAEVMCLCLSWQLPRSRVWWTSWEPGRTPVTSRTACMEIGHLLHVSAHSTCSALRVTIRNSFLYSCRKVRLRHNENRRRISKVK